MNLYVSPSPLQQGGGVGAVVKNLALHTKYPIVPNPVDADIFHVHGLAEDPGRMDVYTSHGIYIPIDWPGENHQRLNDLMIKRMRRAKYATSVADWPIRYIEDTYGVTDVIRIPNGVTRETLDIYRNQQCIIDEVDLNKPTFLYLGYWNPVKNPIDIIDVARYLPDYNFLLTCEENYHYDATPNVYFLGHLDHTTAMVLLANCSALLSPFPRENCSIATLEAYGLDTPVVGKVCEVVGGGNKEMIIPDLTGQLYYDLESFVDGCNAIVEGKYDVGAIQKLSKVYNWGDIASRYDHLYQPEDIPVSCIVMAYNEHDTLPHCLLSIPPSVEIVFVDASNNHEGIVANIPNLKRITVPNTSIGDNRCRALQACTREFVTLLDADDYALEPKWTLYRYLVANPSWSMVFSNSYQPYDNYPTFHNLYEHICGEEMTDGECVSVERMLKANYCSSGSTVFRRSLADHDLFGNYNWGEDYLGWLKLAYKGEAHYIDELAYVYTGSSGGTGGDGSSKLCRNSTEDIQNAFKDWMEKQR